MSYYRSLYHQHDLEDNKVTQCCLRIPCSLVRPWAVATNKLTLLESIKDCVILSYVGAFESNDKVVIDHITFHLQIEIHKQQNPPLLNLWCR